MQLVPSKCEDGTYETVVRIGLNGEEEFHFCRDRDKGQLIYPARPKAARCSISVRGPDEFGADKSWRIRGPTGDRVAIRLQVLNGALRVSAESSSSGIKTWRGLAGQVSYFAICHTQGAGVVELQPCISHEGTEVFRGILSLPRRECQGSFRILVDEDPRRALYPEMANALSGVSAVKGPDAYGSGLEWQLLSSEPGAFFEITLDLGQRDRRKVVMWKLVEAAVPM